LGTLQGDQAFCGSGVARPGPEKLVLVFGFSQPIDHPGLRLFKLRVCQQFFDLIRQFLSAVV